MDLKDKAKAKSESDLEILSEDYEQEKKTDSNLDAQNIEVNEEDIAQIIASVSTLVEEKQEMENNYLRLQADFDNFRKRTRQEKENMALKANFCMMQNLLPIIDNFERAISAEKDQSSFYEGIEMIYKQMLLTFENLGLELMNTVGEEFNPEFHEAVIKEAVKEDKDKAKVLAELQKGYLFNGSLLRAAMVKVGV